MLYRVSSSKSLSTEMAKEGSGMWSFNREISSAPEPLRSIKAVTMFVITSPGWGKRSLFLRGGRPFSFKYSQGAWSMVRPRRSIPSQLSIKPFHENPQFRKDAAVVDPMKEVFSPGNPFQPGACQILQRRFSQIIEI